MTTWKKVSGDTSSSSFRRKLTILALGVASVTFAVPVIAAGPEYHVVSTIASEAGHVSDLLADGEARRLYALRANGVDVFDIDSGTKVGAVTVSGTPGDIALAPELKRGFVTSGDTVIMFDIATLEPVMTVETGPAPRDLTYDPRTQRLFVSNGKGGQLSAFDANTGEVVGHAALGGALTESVADNRGHLFVADEGRSVLHVVDTTSLAELGTIPVWPGVGPTALVMDDKERRIYVAASEGRMIVIDPDSGQMIGYVPIGQGEGGMAAEFLPARFVRLFVPTADGGLTVIQNAKLTASIESRPSVDLKGTAIAVDPKTGRAFAAADAGILVLAK